MMKKRKEAKTPGPDLAFDPVDAALRQLFDAVSAENIPDDFADLIARLENETRPAERK